MNYIYKLFNRGIKWNSFEAITYQIILIAHQIYLFQKSDTLTFGLIATLFSLLYLIIPFLNFGFDKSLPSFFAIFTKSQKDFKKIFLSQFIIQILLLTFVATALILFNENIINIFSFLFNYTNLNVKIIYIFSLLIIVESIKRTLRMMAQLTFLNKQSAILEVCSIILYITLFWGSYFYYSDINPLLSFSSLLIESSLMVFAYSILIFNFYKKIPSEIIRQNLEYDILPRFIKARISNFINQISHLFFSGNFIISFFASAFGVAQICSLKLINDVGVFLTVIIDRIFGFTSSALLAQFKEESKSIKKNALNFATEKLYTVLISMLIFLFINFNFIFKFISKECSYTYLSPSLLFLLIIIFENFFITYELFFLLEEKLFYISLINAFTVILFYLIKNNLTLSLLNSLLFLLCMRIITFILIRLISFYKLKVTLPYKINLRYVLFSIFFSLLFLSLRNLF